MPLGVRKGMVVASKLTLCSLFVLSCDYEDAPHVNNIELFSLAYEAFFLYHSQTEYSRSTVQYLASR